eukprot:Awhi_evm1s12743
MEDDTETYWDRPWVELNESEMDNAVHQITNNIFVGDKSSAKDKSFFIKNGITGVVNLCPSVCPNVFENSTIFESSSAIPCGIDAKTMQVASPINILSDSFSNRETSVKYHAIPIEDVKTTDILSKIPEALEFIEAHLSLSPSNKILIHCNAGVSRSGTIIIAYIMKSRNLSREEAY